MTRLIIEQPLASPGSANNLTKREAINANQHKIILEVEHENKKLSNCIKIFERYRNIIQGTQKSIWFGLMGSKDKAYEQLLIASPVYLFAILYYLLV